jgi:hypothetical protein
MFLADFRGSRKKTARDPDRPAQKHPQSLNNDVRRQRLNAGGAPRTVDAGQ